MDRGRARALERERREGLTTRNCVATNSALVGPVDEELDAELDLSETRAPPLKAIKF
jgi:hypothetical protein